MQISNVRKFVVQAAVKEITEDSSIEEVLKAAENMGANEAASIITPEGKPRMLMLSAWMVHEGRNKNGAAFVKEELLQRVEEGLFKPPFGGMVDFDHDFNPVGFWYNTSFAFDAAASKWGILAQGAIWAWRFPEVADKLLAQMQENGHIEVSMSVIGESEEITKKYPGALDQYTLILHNPVFLTTSVLTVPPADPDAKGVAGFSVEDIEQIAKVLSNSEEEIHMDELKSLQEKIDGLTADLETANASLEEANGKIGEFESQISSLTEELDSEKSSKATIVAELEQVKQTLETVQAEMKQEQTNKSTLEVSLESASQTVTELTTKITELETELEAFRARAEEEAAEELLASRIAELPENVQENLDRHENKESLMASFRAASEAEWEGLKAILVLSSSDRMIKRSKDQKTLLSGGDGGNQQSSLSRFLR